MERSNSSESTFHTENGVVGYTSFILHSSIPRTHTVPAFPSQTSSPPFFQPSSTSPARKPETNNSNNSQVTARSFPDSHVTRATSNSCTCIIISENGYACHRKVWHYAGRCRHCNRECAVDPFCALATIQFQISRV
ncbi:hypothetical protein E2542_SST13400 [Spatholobus suberectus]|nr:hypothetical protein E2542_SST13400 [Spatholobus suberectus]